MEVVAPAPVDEKATAAFERDGAICLRGFFAPEWVDRLREGIERLRDRPGPLGEVYGGGDGGFYGDRFIWTFDEAFRDFALHSPAGAIMGALLRAPPGSPLFRPGLGEGPG